MIGFVIIAHQPLASAFLECITHVMGSTPEATVAIDIGPDQPPAELVDTIAGQVSALTGCEAVFLMTDLFGATPSNAATQALSEKIAVPAQVIAGCNLPMLLRALTYRDQPFQALAEKIVSGGRNGIVSTSATPPQRQTFNPANEDASARNYHQQ